MFFFFLICNFLVSLLHVQHKESSESRWCGTQNSLYSRSRDGNFGLIFLIGYKSRWNPWISLSCSPFFFNFNLLLKLVIHFNHSFILFNHISLLFRSLLLTPLDTDNYPFSVLTGAAVTVYTAVPKDKNQYLHMVGSGNSLE